MRCSGRPRVFRVQPLLLLHLDVAALILIDDKSEHYLYKFEGEALASFVAATMKMKACDVGDGLCGGVCNCVFVVWWRTIW